MKVALFKFTAYGAAALIGACFSGYGLLAAAERLVRNYPEIKVAGASSR